MGSRDDCSVSFMVSAPGFKISSFIVGSPLFTVGAVLGAQVGAAIVGKADKISVEMIFW